MTQENKSIRPLSVAPMMDWTDRHCRYFHRLISPNVMLYTEMVTTGALLHGDRERFLRHSPEEYPLALQLGGSNPEDLAQCAKMGEDAGYTEINLNCGCPSDRVQKGMIGAILMEHPDLVADCVAAMKNVVDIPVTVKCRIGIDEQDDFEFLNRFVTSVKNASANAVIIHARKAWLSGLSPKENRTKPPIHYDRVLGIKKKHLDIPIGVNGEIKTLEATQNHLKNFDNVMIGREAYQNPYILAELEEHIFETKVKSRAEIARAMISYIERQMEEYNTPVKSITRHMTGLFHKQKGAKKWRQLLSTLPHQDGTNAQIIETALNEVGL